MTLKVEDFSALYTISFTALRLNPDREDDICVYFALDTSGAGTFVTDLALLIRGLGQELTKWSALRDPDYLDRGDTAQPTLRDFAYCWDWMLCVKPVSCLL